MGKGKGSHSIWICPIRKGQIIFELANVPQFLAEHALKSASSKLPLVTKISKNLY
jgi:large subunit ribosomal protein L16